MLAGTDGGAALARLHRAEATMATELAAVREAIAQIEATLNAPTVKSSLLTVVEAAEELRVSRTRIFELLAAGHLEGVRLGRSRCVSRRSINALLSRIGAG
jgi:excisionase family DNA binding protein